MSTLITTTAKPALFLDRDGIINIDKGYVFRKEDFEFVEGIFDLCRAFGQEGFLIVVVTNQSGIARGLYTEEDFQALSLWMTGKFLEHGVRLHGLYHCPDHPDFTIDSNLRKPNPGMLLQASKDLDIDLRRSLLIGDKASDLEAAVRAGLARQYLHESNTPIRPDEILEWIRSAHPSV